MRQFLLAQLANFAAVIAGSITFIAFPWGAYEISQSSAVSAMALAFTSIPVILLSPFMGSLIDKFGRRRVAGLSELAAALMVFLVPVMHGLWGMGIVAFTLLGLVKNFFSPTGQTARKSLVPDIAEHAKLTLDRANTIHESVFAAGFAAGPAIASFLIAKVDVYAAFGASGVAALVSAIAVAFIRVSEKQEHDPNEEKGNAFVFAIQGLKTLGRIKVLGLVFSGFLLLAIIYIPTEMIVLPRYFKDIGDPQALGFLITTMAAMSMATTVSFEWLHRRIGYANILRIALIGVSFAMIPMSFLPPQWAMILFGAVLGGVWGPIAPLLNTVIQKLVAANMRGRVFALEMMMWNMAPMTSFIVVGWAIDTFTVQPVYFTLAVLMMLGSVSLAFAPRLKDLKAIEN